MACEHMQLIDGKRGRYCVDCGSLIEPLPQVQPAPAYYRQLEDARRLGWHCVGDMPPIDDAYYAAWQLNNGRWMVVRVPAGAALPHPATHWHGDALGLPNG